MKNVGVDGRIFLKKNLNAHGELYTMLSTTFFQYVFVFRSTCYIFFVVSTLRMDMCSVVCYRERVAHGGCTGFARVRYNW